MSAYFDSGVLIKAYIREPNSPEAIALIRQETAVSLTHFHEIEIRTALRLKRGRGEITEAHLKGALSDLKTDVEAGRFERPACDFSEVFRKAEELSGKHAAATLARTLDILHVATAVVIGANKFVTFDSRQAALATLAGLKVQK